MTCPPLAYFCIRALATVTDSIAVDRVIQCPLNALVDQHDQHDPCLWATIAQLVHPLPAHFHDIDMPLSHPQLPLIQRVSDTPSFSLITLLSLPNCSQLRDDSIGQIASLNHLVALDLRGTRISAYALTVLARALNPSTRTGIWRLRLLSLHSCPSIDNDVLAVLQNFPLLSAIDLRFTNCSPALVKAQLSPLGFRPSENKSLFHPAPLFLALCALENIANSASPPISLYSSPLSSVFRIHIDALHQPSHRPKRSVPVYPPSTSTASIRTTSFAGDTGTVTFIPPVRKSVTKRNSLPLSSSISNQDVDLVSPRHSTASSTSGQPITINDLPDGREMREYSFQRSRRVSRIRSRDNAGETELAPRADGYQNEARDLPSSCPTSSGPADPPVQSADQTNRSRNRILPLSAQAVRSLEEGRLEPLAITRSPPPWSILESYDHQSSFSEARSDSSRKTQSVFGWTARSLDEPAKVDRARLHKRSSTAVADMINKLAAKRPKVESEFARVKAQERLPVKPRNPFTKSTKSVFAESMTVSDHPRCSAQGSSVEAEPGEFPQACDSLPTKSQEDNSHTKLLKPITTLKPPTLPKELLAHPSKPPHPKAELRQTRLAFTRDGSGTS